MEQATLLDAAAIAEPPGPPDTDALRRKLSFSDVSADELPPTGTTAAPEKLRVIVRARPLGPTETQSDITLSDTAVAMRSVRSSAQGRDSVEESSFFFDNVYKGNATQAQVFEGAMLPQVRALFAGRDTLTFAYGITNAGKTYTIQGKEQKGEIGCIPRALEATFAALRHHTEWCEAEARGAPAPAPPAGAAGSLGLDPACTYEVRASFIEVYGNDVFDLLAAPPEVAAAKGGGAAPPRRAVLRLKEDRGQVFVEGLKEVELPDLESAVRAVQLGWAQRASASNGLNVESSRSHAVLCVKLLTQRPGADRPTATRLCVVDLAGAERQKKTQTNGARLNEAMSINKDLMVLGHCLRDLRYNQVHPNRTSQKVPPFRDSRITMLFRDYLSGSGQISVIAAISPRLSDAAGTLDTLKFAAVAQQVKVVERPPPRAAPAPNLPRVAGGNGIPTAATIHSSNLAAVGPRGGTKPTELVRDSSFVSELGSSHGDLAVAAAEVEQLREQVAALQERLLSANAERASLERTIREEVAEEMKEHLESTEAAMEQRLEMERYNAEELYLEKISLLKGATIERANAQSVAAHTEILQQTRDNQRREAEHATKITRLEAALEQERVDLEAARADQEAARAEIDALREMSQREASEELSQALAAAAAAEARLAEETQARGAAEEALHSLEATGKQQAIEVENLQFQLSTERDAKAALQKELHDMQARCASLVELSRNPSGTSAGNRRASRQPAAKENARARGGKAAAAATVTLAEEGETAAGGGGDALSPSKRNLGDATNVLLDPSGEAAAGARQSRRSTARSGSSLSQAEVEQQAVLVGAAGQAPKPSMLRQLRGKGLFRAKNKADAPPMADDTAAGVFLDIGAPPSNPPPNAPEQTPIKHRTRGISLRVTREPGSRGSPFADVFSSPALPTTAGRAAIS